MVHDRSWVSFSYLDAEYASIKDLRTKNKVAFGISLGWFNLLSSLGEHTKPKCLLAIGIGYLSINRGDVDARVWVIVASRSGGG